MADREEKAKSSLNEAQYRAWKKSRRQAFETLGKQGRTEVQLPGGVQIGGVYTPQYGRIVKPGDTLSEQTDEDAPTEVYSYIMNNGFTEHTLVWLVKDNDPDDGWTVEVEPLSGRVHLHGELLDLYDVQKRIPDEGPSLPN